MRPEVSEESKKIAIEFAKRMFATQIKSCKRGCIGEVTEFEIVDVPEFQLMLCELERNGDELFSNFIDEYIS